MQKITPCLWFDGKAEEAMNFYTAIFKDSRVTSVMRHGDAGPGPKGSVLATTFHLEGQEFIALNGGPMFTFSPAISFFVHCETQAEIDDYWASFPMAGKPSSAAGLETSSGCPGKSFRQSCKRCCRTRIPGNRSESWRPC